MMNLLYIAPVRLKSDMLLSFALLKMK